jgi:hypothetical protein
LIILALLLLPLLFWWQLWTPDLADRAAIPEGDFSEQYFPLQLFAAREVAAGRVPVWNPYINAGQPGLADIQTGFYYPLNLLPNLVLAVLGISYGIWFLTGQVVLHFSLASLFTYLLVRHLVRRAGARLPAARFAGALAAVSFTYAGYLTSFPVQQLTILETSIWLPLILLFVDRSFHRERPLPQIVLAGVALACALLAGHPQTAMYLVYTTLAYGCFLVWSTRTEHPDSRLGTFLARLAYHGVLPLLVAVGLAAIQLVPTIGFIIRSTRAGLDYEAVSWGFPLAEMTHLIYPGYFGGSPQYVGILAPILAVAALFVKRARREVVFWMAVGVVALVLAFGGHLFLYTGAYLLVPGFGSVRNQERIIVLFSLAIAVLAGYGSVVLVQPLPRLMRRGFRRYVQGLGWATVAFLALTVLWIFGFLLGQQQGAEVNLFEGVLRHHILALVILTPTALLFTLRVQGRGRRGWLMVVALGIVWLNLFTVNWRFNQVEGGAGGGFPRSATVAFLKGQPGTFRISSAGLLPGGASAGIVYELEDITGNTPLRLDAFQQFEERVQSWRRWQLLNVKFVLSERDLDGPGLERVHEEEQVKVYRVGDPLERAWLVHHTVAAMEEEAFDLLNATNFDPKAVAVLPPDSEGLLPSSGNGVGGIVQELERLPNHLVFDVQAREEGLLVVSQVFYPGWQAAVDGQPVPIHQVDQLLQGIRVEAGTHRVELSYHLSIWPAAISVLVMVACAVVLLLRMRWVRLPKGSRSSENQELSKPV